MSRCWAERIRCSRKCRIKVSWYFPALLTERREHVLGATLLCYTRTTAIRNLTNPGVPIQRIMQMTGHKNVPTHMGYNVADEKDLALIRKLYDEK